MQRADSAELSLEQTKRRFEQWRRKNCYGRYPHDLWDIAAATAAICGAELTAERLGIDVERLKQWMRCRRKNGESAEVAAGAFVELPLFDGGGTPECTLELEEPCGRKLRISLKGPATRQVVELGQMLIRSSP